MTWTTEKPKQPGRNRREPIADPYPAKFRIGGAIVVFTASILFLSAFPVCRNSGACSQVVGMFAFFGTCFFLAWRKPVKPKPHCCTEWNGSTAQASRMNNHSLAESQSNPTVPANLRDELECLLEEIIKNRELATRLYEVGGRSGIKMTTLAWDVVKHNLEGLDKHLAAGVRLGYMEIWRFNIFVDWDWAKDPLPKGITPEACMHNMMLRVKVALAITERELSSYLAR